MKKLIILLTVCTSLTVLGQKMQMPKIQLLLLADASNSMLQKWQTKTKKEVLMASLQSFFQKTSKYGEFQYALRLFGHIYPTIQANCTDSRLEVAFANETVPLIRQTFQKAQPKGVSPVAYSLEQCEKDFTVQASKKIILLFTDGPDACNRSVCEQCERLQASGLYAGVYVVGLNVTADLDQLTCVKGFKNAETEADLNVILDGIFAEIKPW